MFAGQTSFRAGLLWTLVVAVTWSLGRRCRLPARLERALVPQSHC